MWVMQTLPQSARTPFPTIINIQNKGEDRSVLQESSASGVLETAYFDDSAVESFHVLSLRFPDMKVYLLQEYSYLYAGVD